MLEICKIQAYFHTPIPFLYTYFTLALSVLYIAALPLQQILKVYQAWIILFVFYAYIHILLISININLFRSEY
jgi:hypothetical protein